MNFSFLQRVVKHLDKELPSAAQTRRVPVDQRFWNGDFRRQECAGAPQGPRARDGAVTQNAARAESPEMYNHPFRSRTRGAATVARKHVLRQSQVSRHVCCGNNRIQLKHKDYGLEPEPFIQTGSEPSRHSLTRLQLIELEIPKIWREFIELFSVNCRLML